MIDALTLTRNGYKRLKALHQTLKVQTIADQVRWSLWDNASTQQGLVTLLGKLKKDPIVAYQHRSTSNQSFSRANNLLAARGRSPYILLLNDDILFHRTDTLERMVAMMEANPQIGALGIKLFFPNGTIQHAGVCGYPGGSLSHFGYGQPDTDPAYSLQRELQAVTGACMLVRREVWEQVQGLDERFWFCFEDIHLCMKIRSLGYKVVYDGQNAAIHAESLTFKEQGDSSDKVRNIQRNYPILHKGMDELGMDILPDVELLKNPQYAIYHIQ